MGLYSDVLFPMCFDFFMELSPYIEKYRKELLKNVKGNILEIGFGTGLNLPHYPDHVRALNTVDPNPGLTKKALKKIERSLIKVNHYTISGENLPMEDNTFDSITCSWTLCSIPDVDQALKEISRVLKPDGRFYFIEHGLSCDPKVQKWQQRLNPIQKIIAVGCHINRNMREIIGKQLTILELKKFYIEKGPKTHGYMFQGIAEKL